MAAPNARNTFLVAVGVCLTVLAASAANGAGLVGWGSGAPPPAISASPIAVGWEHYCAIEAGSGAVTCWGSNHWGQATSPVIVNGTAGTASAIAAGGNHTLALPEPGCEIMLTSGAALLRALRRRRRSEDTWE